MKPVTQHWHCRQCRAIMPERCPRAMLALQHTDDAQMFTHRTYARIVLENHATRFSFNSSVIPTLALTMVQRFTRLSERPCAQDGNICRERSICCIGLHVS